MTESTRASDNDSIDTVDNAAFLARFEKNVEVRNQHVAQTLVDLATLGIGVTTPAMFSKDTPKEQARRTAAFNEALATNHLAALDQPTPANAGYAPPGCRIVGKISDFPELQAEIRKGLEDGTLSVS